MAIGSHVIPYPIPPLTGVAVVVTRPEAQAAALCERIAQLGGQPFKFPVIAIEPIAYESSSNQYHHVIFVSANAVEHGLSAAPQNSSLVAIGPSTNKALQAQKRVVDLVAPAPFTSEALLTLPQMANVSGQRILIVRGEGGRDILKETLMARGAQVDYLNVYRRVRTEPSPQSMQQLKLLREQADELIVTFTSVDILEHWLALLGEQAIHFALLPIFVSSARIAAAAKQQGLRGDCIIAAAAGDEALLGAMSHWHTRARSSPSTYPSKTD